MKNEEIIKQIIFKKLFKFIYIKLVHHFILRKSLFKLECEMRMKTNLKKVYKNNYWFNLILFFLFFIFYFPHIFFQLCLVWVKYLKEGKKTFTYSILQWKI